MTNIGSIPGFYYDEDKKKYYKIQANHLVPQGAKYSRGSVKKDARAAKKRKTGHKQKVVRERQTVKRSRVLQDAITGGIALARELGHASIRTLIDDSSKALISRWRVQRVEVLDDIFPCQTRQHQRLLCARFLPNTNQMLLATTPAYNKSSVLTACPWDWDIKRETVEHFEIPSHGPGPSRLAAFSDAITSIATSEAPSEGGPPRVVACADRSLIMDLVSTPHSDPSYHGWICQIQQRAQPITALSLHPTTGRTAYMCEDYASVLGSRGESISTMHLPFEHESAPCIDWLDTNTVVYGDNTARKLMLWDSRTRDEGSGTSARFDLRGRITGIYAAGSKTSERHGSSSSPRDSNTILVSTNHGIHIFDTRMPAAAVESSTPSSSPQAPCFPHVHQGPRLQFAVNACGLIAAVDRDDVVQVYSMWSLARIGALSMLPLLLPPSSAGVRSMVTDLQWYEDRRGGPVLQACQGNAVVRWSWGGAGGRDGCGDR